MSQFKNKELLQMSAALTEMQQLKRLSPKLIYFVAKNSRVVDDALQAYHSAKNALLEAHGTGDPKEPGKFTFETLDKAKAFLAEDRELQELHQDLPLATVAFSDIEAYQNRVADTSNEGLTPAALAGLWPLLNGAPSEA